MKKIILFLFSFTLFMGCSMQKRKYQRGFYVTRAHNKTSEKNREEKDRSQNINYKIISDKLPEHNSYLLADAKNETAILKPAQKNYLLLNDSCDEIIFMDGREVKVKINEVGLDEIKYKRCNMPDGPLYVVKKTEIFMVKYANGTKEVFKNEAAIYSGNNAIKNPAPGTAIQQKNSPLATLSLVFGILGIYPLMGIGSIVAIACGVAARKQIKRSPDMYKGISMANAGIWLGVVMLALLLLILFIFLALLTG